MKTSEYKLSLLYLDCWKKIYQETKLLVLLQHRDN
jgi:hypothetical protein